MTKHASLTKALDKTKNINQAATVFERIKKAQDKNPDDHDLWELRIRALRRLGENLPPKHTGQGGARGAGLPIDRRQAYKARLVAGVQPKRFERILKEWRKTGERPKVQLFLKMARKDRGEDPAILVEKLQAALGDLKDALAGTPANVKALASAERAIGKLDLDNSKLGKERARQRRDRDRAKKAAAGGSKKKSTKKKSKKKTR
ncbi:MAG: hypothetical protein JKY65_11200 [Planctomycetes bacterium]|nr:hypothetical protein [Planctomycetota bacterium]